MVILHTIIVILAILAFYLTTLHLVTIVDDLRGSVTIQTEFS
jgi:hypothetical protein